MSAPHAGWLVRVGSAWDPPSAGVRITLFTGYVFIRGAAVCDPIDATHSHITEGSSRIRALSPCLVGRQPVYIIGIPTFASVTVRLGPAAKLQILRVGQGAYVQSATLDAAPLNGRGWLHVAEVHGGGGGGGGGAQVLRLTMGGTPSSEWGRQRPPNFRVPDTMES
jgi:hypothetical protein